MKEERKKAPNYKDPEQRQKEWDEVEALVMLFQKQFEEVVSDEQRLKSQNAAAELIQRFSPFFRKYLTLFKTGHIDFNDKELKMFIYTFVNDKKLQRALTRKKQKSTYRKDIYTRFNFVKETYGGLGEEDIMMDLHTLFLVLARRYKQAGRSFCAYLYNAYKFEVSRHVKKYISDPLNVFYKHSEYEDNLNGYRDKQIEEAYEDSYYEDSMGLPDLTWISGENCSETFSTLNNLERKIIIKYYLEEWNDRQISESFGVHINTINQKRRVATTKVAASLGLAPDKVIRSRKSGINAILQNNI